MQPPSLRISEIFTSIQGEGLLTGVPSVFIRTSGCNLRCRWCDTPETSWQPSGSRQSIDAIMNAVQDTGIRHIVLTGGEPLIAPGITELVHRLAEDAFHITLETAASFDVNDKVVRDIDLPSISPKLAGSTPQGSRFALAHEQRRYRPDVIRVLMSKGEYQLKFVPSAPSDLDEIERIIEETSADRKRVLLMAEGTTADALDRGAEWLVPECLRRGFRYCDRVHIRLFGHRRGT